jgi:hypothetical protein
MDLAIENFDLVMSKSIFDITDELDAEKSLNQEIVENFDMQIGDDIDYPELHSNQRLHVNSSDTVSEMQRVEDAKRILAEYPIEDVDIEFVNGKLNASWRMIV